MKEQGRSTCAEGRNEVLYGRFGWFGHDVDSVDSMVVCTCFNVPEVDLRQVESVLDGSEQMVWFVMTSIP